MTETEEILGFKFSIDEAWLNAERRSFMLRKWVCGQEFTTSFILPEDNQATRGTLMHLDYFINHAQHELAQLIKSRLEGK